MERRSTTISEPIRQLQRQLEQFLGTHSQRTKLSGAPWRAATELARQRGVSHVAHLLRLDCAGLKKRLDGVAVVQPTASKPALVEWLAPGPVQPDECVIEVESAGGSKMHIQRKTTAPPDWAGLLRACPDGKR